MAPYLLNGRLGRVPRGVDGEVRLSLTLFRKKRFAGDCHPVTRSQANLRVTPVGYRARSLTMTSPHDRALLFSRKMYGGRVAFTHGIQNVPNSPRTFFKPIRAVRIDPFRLHLKVTVLCSRGRFPGSWTSERDACSSVDFAIDWANRVWSTGLLWFERRKTAVEDRPKRFDVKWPWSGVPRDRGQPRMINVVFVNRIGRGGTLTRRWPPVFGETIVLARVSKRGEISDQRMGHCLARELGRYLRLHDARPSDDPRNLMFPGRPITLDPTRIQLQPAQIQQVHEVLVSNCGRGADRHN